MNESSAKENEEKRPVRPTMREKIAARRSALPGRRAWRGQELAQLADEVRELSCKLDKARVHRAFRDWINWVEQKASHDPIRIAIFTNADGISASDLFSEFDLSNDVENEYEGARAIEIRAPKQLPVGKSSPCWPVVESAFCPEGVALIVLHDWQGALEDLPFLADLRQATAAAVTLTNSEGFSDEGVFHSLPLGHYDLRLCGVAGQPAKFGEFIQPERRFVLTVGRDAKFIKTLEQIFPASLQSKFRDVIAAHELQGLARQLIASEIGIEDTAKSLAYFESNRSRRNEILALQRELAATESTRGQVANLLKDLAANLREQKSKFSAKTMVAQSTALPFEELEAKFAPELKKPDSELIGVKEKPAWWKGSAVAVFKHLLTKKFEISIKEDLLRTATDDLERRTLATVGTLAVEFTYSFNSILADVESAASPPGASDVSAYYLEKVYQDDFFIGNKRPPGGAPAPSELSKEIKSSISSAFGNFATEEVRTFRLEREDKGLLGQLTEARSAVFGFYFLFLLVTRVIPEDSGERRAEPDDPENGIPSPANPATDVSQTGVEEITLFNDPIAWVVDRDNLPWLLLVLIGLGFIINFATRPRQERAKLAEKVRTKLDDLTGRLISFVERLAKEQLDAIEDRIATSSAQINFALERRSASLKARLEQLSSVEFPTRPERSSARSRETIADVSSKLSAELGGDLANDQVERLQAL